ncbi:MAG: von Willebrand factor type A domain-containing protein, partial [Phycisphaerales bacterium]
MKRKDEQFEKNISRLVKLAGDSDKPSEAFQKSLTDETLKELKQHGTGQQRGRRDTIMTAKRILTLAASVVIVAGVLAVILTPHLARVRRLPQVTKDMSQTTDTYSQLNKKSDLRKEPTSKPREIVYTQSDEKKAAPSVTATPQVSSDLYTAGKVKEEAEKVNYYYRGKEPLGLEDKTTELGRIDVANRRLLKQAPAGVVDGLVAACRPMPTEPGTGGYPPAHGGTRPPNDEDVDAQFFKNYGVNPFVDTEDDHLSTFATDVDTGSYTIVRKYLHDGHIPPESAVRVEEFVNYFKYNYQAPQEDDFAVYAEVCPWTFGKGRKNSHLLRLGLKAKQITEENRKPAILTFVIDVSGSMRRENRLGLVKRSLQMLVENLRPEDKIGIAVYGSSGRKVMSHKGLDEKDEIISAIEKLSAGGSTYAEQGIRIGYEMADEVFEKGCINRVILCSDGVANVGRTGADSILEVIKKKAKKGITLSAIGFGMGNYNDVLLEQLGDKGNGYYAYVDTIAEAKK